MANYKPVTVSIGANSIYNANGTKLDKNVTTTSWHLAFIYGTAVGVSIKASGSTRISAPIVLSNGTVLGWYSTVAGNIADADIQTFTGAGGQYGVTVNSDYPLTIRFYSQG